MNAGILHGKHALPAGERIDRLLEGKPKGEQMKTLRAILDYYKTVPIPPIDRCIEARNRLVHLENSKPKAKPMEEGLMCDRGLAVAMALSGSGGC